jgi:5-methyltetrahydrofolate--homocysteine methyltransferase
MHPLIPKLLAEGPVVTDGAWGTELQRHGLEIGECPDAWNLDHPGRVEYVARVYVDAGSRIILTNTFRANRIALAQLGLAEKAAEINRRGVEISRRAAGSRARVFASMGPTGKLLIAGEVSEDQLHDTFREQAKALAEGGADGLVLETLSDLAEAKVAVAAARETGLPVVACMTFDSGKRRDRTMMGTTPEEAAAELTAAGADVVGANCGQGIEGFAPLCQRLRGATDRPLWLKPNAGIPELVGNHPVYATTPEVFAESARALVTAGAAFIGGCCGTHSEFIRALVRALAQTGLGKSSCV